MALLFDMVPGVRNKNIFSLTVGVLFLQFALRETWIHSLVSSLLCYTCVLFLPPSVAPQLVFAISIFWVSLTHFYRMYTLDWMADPFALPDPSGTQMVLTIKLTSFAFNILDGHTYFVKGEGASFGVPQKVVDERRSRAIRDIPSLLQYLSYLFFFGGILTGPAFDFVEFSTSIDLSKYGPPVPGARRQIPSPYLPSLKRVLASLFFLWVYLGLSPFVAYAKLGDILLGLPFLERLVAISLASFCERAKYYFVWLMAEGGCILCALGYDGNDARKGTDHWGGMSNVSVLKLELSQSIRDLSVYWNQNTALWLRRYVYERLPGPYANLAATYVVSATWHGFYPGYYIFFLSMGFAQDVSRRIRSRVRPHFLEEDGKTPRASKLVYDVCGGVLTSLFISYVIIAFEILSVEKSMKLWGELYYFGHVLLVVALVGLQFVPKVKSKAKPE